MMPAPMLPLALMVMVLLASSAEFRLRLLPWLRWCLCC